MDTGRVTKAPRVLLQDLDGEAVLLNLANGHYYGLDATSFRMYDVLISASSVQAAYQLLLQEYDVEPDRLRQDFEKFVKDLVRNGLVLREHEQPE